MHSIVFSSLAQHHYLTKHSFVDMAVCPRCPQQQFPDVAAALAHQRLTGHCYCRRCGLLFVTLKDFTKHEASPHSFACGSLGCSLQFRRSKQLQLHQKRSNHEPYCTSYSSKAPTSADLRKHGHSDNNKHQRPDLEHHQDSPISKPFSGIPCIASECKRRFGSTSAVLNHVENSCHSGKCKRRFGSTSALLNHLESGSHSGVVKRQQITELVTDNGVKQVIIGTSDVKPMVDSNVRNFAYSSRLTQERKH